MACYVYLLASERNGTLYVGVSSNIIQRIWQHKTGLLPGFTRTHGVKNLVWYETHESITAAIRREKLIKRWNRSWKIRLIEETNPYWRDLYEEICR
ncbi:MAG: GIY-YIG nuclease family protein [bacterium]|nr:GIY-YIG nuclease family protein [bacterium]